MANKFYGPLEADNNIDPYKLPTELIKDSLEGRYAAADANQDKYYAAKEALAVKTRPLEEDKKLLNSLQSDYENEVSNTVNNVYGGDWSQAAPAVKDIAYKYANDDRRWQLQQAKDLDDKWREFKKVNPNTAYDFTSGESTAIKQNPDGSFELPDYVYESKMDWQGTKQKYFSHIEEDVVSKELPAWVDQMDNLTDIGKLDIKNEIAKINDITDPTKKRDALVNFYYTHSEVIKQNKDKIDALKGQLINNYLQSAEGTNEFRIKQDELRRQNPSLDPEALRQATIDAITTDTQAVADSYIKENIATKVEPHELHVSVPTINPGGSTSSGGSGDGDKEKPSVTISSYTMNTALEGTTLGNLATLESDIESPVAVNTLPVDGNFEGLTNIKAVIGTGIQAPNSVLNKPSANTVQNKFEAANGKDFEITQVGSEYTVNPKAKPNPLFTNVAYLPTNLVKTEKNSNLTLADLKALMDNCDVNNAQKIIDIYGDNISYNDGKGDVTKKISDLLAGGSPANSLATIKLNLMKQFGFLYEKQAKAFNNYSEGFAQVPNKLSPDVIGNFSDKYDSSKIQSVIDQFNIKVRVPIEEGADYVYKEHPFLKNMMDAANNPKSKNTALKENLDGIASKIPGVIEKANTVTQDNIDVANEEFKLVSKAKELKAKLKAKKTQVEEIWRINGINMTYDNFKKEVSEINADPQSANLKQTFDQNKVYATLANNDLPRLIPTTLEFVATTTNKDYAIKVVSAVADAAVLSNANGLTENEFVEKLSSNEDIKREIDNGRLDINKLKENYRLKNVGASLEGFDKISDAAKQQYQTAKDQILKNNGNHAVFLKAYVAIDEAAKTKVYETSPYNYVYHSGTGATNVQNRIDELMLSKGIESISSGNSDLFSEFNERSSEKFKTERIDKEYKLWLQTTGNKTENPETYSEFLKKNISFKGFTSQGEDGFVGVYNFQPVTGSPIILEVPINQPKLGSINFETSQLVTDYGINKAVFKLSSELTEELRKNDGDFATGLRLGNNTFDFYRVNAGGDKGYYTVIRDGVKLDKTFTTIEEFMSPSNGFLTGGSNMALAQYTALSKRIEAFDNEVNKVMLGKTGKNAITIDRAREIVSIKNPEYANFNYDEKIKLRNELKTEVAGIVTGRKDDDFKITDDGKQVLSKKYGALEGREITKGIYYGKDRPGEIPNNTSLADATHGSNNRVDDTYLIPLTGNYYKQLNSDFIAGNVVVSTENNFADKVYNLLQVIQPYVQKANGRKTVTVNSSLRSLENNEKLETSAKTSPHLTGQAIDLQGLSGGNAEGTAIYNYLQSNEGLDYLRKSGLRILRHKPDHIHVEVRNDGEALFTDQIEPTKTIKD